MTTHDNADYDKDDLLSFLLRPKAEPDRKDAAMVALGDAIRAKTKMTVVTDTRGNTHEITPPSRGL
jgi:hypothetical protein